MSDTVTVRIAEWRKLVERAVAAEAEVERVKKHADKVEGELGCANAEVEKLRADRARRRGHSARDVARVAGGARMMSRLVCVPLTLAQANACVDAWHRHHPPIPGGFNWFCAGAVTDGHLCGAAIAGRSTNRNNDDGQTVEVLRLATDGTPNACSFLLGACARAAKAIGARRCITYTLDEEGGASLRASGWNVERKGIQSWWTTPSEGRSAGVEREHSDKRKVRWAVHFHEGRAFSMPDFTPPASQPSLF